MKKENDTEISIGQKIKNALEAASSEDGLKRTQRWLSSQTGIAEVALSNKIAGHDKFKEGEVEKINEVLGTSLKI